MSRKQQRMHRKSWISKGILKSIKTKNKLFSKIQNLDKTDSNKRNKYKKYRNKLNHIIEYAKMTYLPLILLILIYIFFFSKYFSSIGEKLSNQIDKPILAAPKTSPASNLQTSFFLSPTCPEEVQKEISNLNAKKAVPMNDIPIKYLKLAGTTISKFMSDLFNTCILDSEYPDDLKIPQIIPIHKSGSKECCSTYRPISILPAINKVFEKLLCSR